MCFVAENSDGKKPTMNTTLTAAEIATLTARFASELAAELRPAPTGRRAAAQHAATFSRTACARIEAECAVERRIGRELTDAERAEIVRAARAIAVARLAKEEAAAAADAVAIRTAHASMLARAAALVAE